MYDAEKMLHHNSENLRRFLCEINLMFLDGEFNTPAELKQFGIRHYKQLYEAEQHKLDTLNYQIENIVSNEDKFKDKTEYVRRIEHFKELIQKQREKTTKYKKVCSFIINAIEKINKVMEKHKNNKTEDFDNQAMDVDDNQENYDNMCAICLNTIAPPIAYIKTCGHYFCRDCIDGMIKHGVSPNCPHCREPFNRYNVIIVQEMSDINNSSKIHELLNIINHGSYGGKYIIFTQFDKVIDKIKIYLMRNNIVSETLDKYDGEQILLLSSKQNAEGINLSMFDKMIIFEPFEDNHYNVEVEKQLIARIHRIGRSKPVDVYRFITKGTIEEDIYNK
jgi:SNF2 family DNA or RNA helicase